MGPVPLVVLDTNVLVSAFGWNGPERQVYRLCRTGDLRLAISGELLAELERVLGYPKFALERCEIEAIVAEVQSVATVVDPVREVQAVPDDPADERVLECAVTAGADWIVSGDRHLLDLDSFETIRIVRSPDVLRRVADGEEG